MNKVHDIVQVKLDQPKQAPAASTNKAFQMRVSEGKTVVVYNHINGYILEALLKAVLTDAH